MQSRYKIITTGIFSFVFLIIVSNSYAQRGFGTIRWNKEGNSYYRTKLGDIVQVSLPDLKETVVVAKEKLIPQGQSGELTVRNFSFSDDNQKVLIYTNTKKVWRLRYPGRLLGI